VLVAVSIDMQAVKLCTNKILQFLTGTGDLRRLTCIMAVKWWTVVVVVVLYVYIYSSASDVMTL